jgi:hypothetical protein
MLMKPMLTSCGKTSHKKPAFHEELESVYDEIQECNETARQHVNPYVDHYHMDHGGCSSEYTDLGDNSSSPQHQTMYATLNGKVKQAEEDAKLTAHCDAVKYRELNSDRPQYLSIFDDEDSNLPPKD